MDKKDKIIHKLKLDLETKDKDLDAEGKTSTVLHTTL